MSESMDEMADSILLAPTADVAAIGGPVTATSHIVGDYQNMHFTFDAPGAIDDPWMAVDTRALDGGVTVAELGKLLSLTMRVRKSIVQRSFAGVAHLFTEAP